MSPKYTDEEVLKEIRRISYQYCGGDAPTNKTFREHGKMASSMPATKFGSWNKAIEEAGLDTNIEYGLSKQKFKERIRNVSEEYCNGSAPTYKEFQKYSDHSSKTVVQRFGSWNEALKECGFDINIPMNTPLSELSSDVKRVSEEHCSGNPPTLGEIEKFGKFPAVTYRKRFDGWWNALSESGFTPQYSEDWPLSGKEHPFWEGGFEQYYGESWHRQRKKALKRDDHSCRICGKGEVEIGRKPSVHHIKPKKRWDVEKEHEDMNSLENLICLCYEHHRKFEGEFVDKSPDEFVNKAGVDLHE
jgi:5-methylcytosine-specific restriction endonuclease McrA